MNNHKPIQLPVKLERKHFQVIALQATLALVTFGLAHITDSDAPLSVCRVGTGTAQLYFGLNLLYFMTALFVGLIRWLFKIPIPKLLIGITLGLLLVSSLSFSIRC